MDAALLLDKPIGASSNRVLQDVKQIFGAKKAGHAGTLDPLASGLLLVLFGEATKFAGPLLDADKEYVATLKLGERTSTGDAEGQLLETKEVEVSNHELLAALDRFRGKIEQLPPMHSALKRDGVPLYKLARRGETVERKPRQVQIFELEKLAFEPPRLEIRVRCSKGTYIRTLAEDLGQALGTLAHLSALRRTACGGFRVADAASLEVLGTMPAAERTRRLLSLQSLLSDLPRVELDRDAETRFRNGQALSMPGLEAGVFAVLRPDGSVIGLGKADAAGALKPLRLTATTQAADNQLKSRA
ncbi:MAG TPA: tRNA pseudouridine(55) synthase TruB [Burkholderiales bacterium]|nr:tRNA pseudouridine(55) synthase TruB [Burkholderiales bacterium]